MSDNENNEYFNSNEGDSTVIGNEEDENTAQPIAPKPRQISSTTGRTNTTRRTIQPIVSNDPLDVNIKQYDEGPTTNKIILEIINNHISRMIADIKSAELGNTNAKVGETVNAINAALIGIQTTLNDGSNALIKTRLEDTDGDFKFNLKKTDDELNKYQYNDTETQFTTAAGDFYDKTKFKNVPVTNAFKTLDSASITRLEENEYMAKHNVLPTDTAAYAAANTQRKNLIQTRLNNCYTLELLYMKKHEEVLKLFAFCTNLFTKYRYAVKLILYLLHSLVYRTKLPTNETDTTQYINNNYTINGDGCPEVKIPKTLIKRIDLMVKDQKDMETIVDGIDKKLKEEDEFQKVERIIKKLPGDGAGGSGAGGRGPGVEDNEEDSEEEDEESFTSEQSATMPSISNEEIYGSAREFILLLEKYLNRESDTDENTLNDFFSTKEDRIKKLILLEIEKNFRSNEAHNKDNYIKFLEVFSNDTSNNSVKDSIDTLIAKLSKVESIYNQLPIASRSSRSSRPIQTTVKPIMFSNQLQQFEVPVKLYLTNTPIIDGPEFIKIKKIYDSLEHSNKEEFIKTISKYLNHSTKIATRYNGIINKPEKLNKLRKLLSLDPKAFVPGIHNS